jgi:hypothetical protein
MIKGLIGYIWKRTLMDGGPATKEEVAEIIFNSSDPGLNTLLQKAKNNNYEIDHLISKISADINGHFSEQLAANSISTPVRQAYLFKQIKSELVYYAKWY